MTTRTNAEASKAVADRAKVQLCGMAPMRVAGGAQAVAPDRTLDDLLSAALRRVDWLEGELLHIERVARVQQTDPLVTNANLAAFRQIERLCRDAIDGKRHAQRSKP